MPTQILSGSIQREFREVYLSLLYSYDEGVVDPFSATKSGVTMRSGVTMSENNTVRKVKSMDV